MDIRLFLLRFDLTCCSSKRVIKVIALKGTLLKFHERVETTTILTGKRLQGRSVAHSLFVEVLIVQSSVLFALT